MARTKIDEVQVSSIMRVCGVSRDEALSIIAEDTNINRMKMSEVDSDLTDQQKAVAKEMRDIGSRKTKAKSQDANAKGPTVYKFDTKDKPKKQDTVKESMVTALATFLAETTAFSVENVEITNPSKEIAYIVGGERYVLSIVRNRPKKK